MGAALLQVALAGFGLVAMWLAMGSSPTGRKWAPVVGLLGQPAWIGFAIGVNAPGLLVLSIAWTLVYARGVWVQWRRPWWRRPPVDPANIVIDPSTGAPVRGS